MMTLHHRDRRMVSSPIMPSSSCIILNYYY